MTSTDDILFRKLVVVSKQVKRQLENNGLAIPVDNHDGSITIGSYTIVKKNGFYSILDFADDVIVDYINLPQTALILANNLALGKFLDNRVLNYDRQYGYSAFEEKLHQKTAECNVKKNVDRADMLFTKSSIHRAKKQAAKREIVRIFEKLRNIV